MTKTNAVRLLEKAGIPFRLAQYDYDENDLNGMHAAQGIGMPPEQVFKTLVARNESNEIFVFCIPVCCELDLKKAALVVKSKKIELTQVKELLALTGYIRGGCSPIGMKKSYPTYLDETADLYHEIAFSAGARGQQIIMEPRLLLQFLPIQTADLTKI